jgi:predicted nucleic acid-binding protein
VKLFLDVNVILDVMTDRAPWAEEASVLLSLLDSPDFDGMVAAHSITTLHYLTSKYLSRKRATAALIDLLKLVSVATVDQDVILKALSLGWDDFEDAVQGICAVEAGVDYFITRDAGQFEALSIPALSPTEFLAMLDAAGHTSTG